MKSILSIVLVTFLATTNLAIAQSHLAYHLKVGDKFKVFQVAEQDIVQNMNASEHNIKNLIEGDYTFTVEHVNDSLYGIKFRYDRFKMVMTSNMIGEIMSINTNDSIADDDIEGKIFSKIIASDLHMEMYKNGKIKSIKGSEILIDNMINAAGDFDDFTKELMKESMRKEFSNESLAMSFEQMTYIYPSKDSKASDTTWTNKFEGKLTSENTWTLVSTSDKAIAISGESEIALNTTDSDVDMHLKGHMTSKISVSPTTGFAQQISTTSTAEGHSVMHNMNSLEVPTSITSNINYKIEKHVQ
ncbi:DUF6263 family protein [Psychroserpens algicola]|uniref:DUF6263 family protein n=1 Tax=Psychroserpens algicola TaxID=1719034 RepID=UPI001953A7CB|nr:DUF6263 family protein [Psychroserpens algicola]